MNFRQVEARITDRISVLEEEESRLQEWLLCLRKVPLIAAEWQAEPTKPGNVTSSPEVEGMSISHIDSRVVEDAAEELFQGKIALETKRGTSEEPLDQLRQKLARKPQGTSGPVFTSQILYEARV